MTRYTCVLGGGLLPYNFSRKLVLPQIIRLWEDCAEFKSTRFRGGRHQQSSCRRLPSFFDNNQLLDAGLSIVNMKVRAAGGRQSPHRHPISLCRHLLRCLF